MLEEAATDVLLNVSKRYFTIHLLSIPLLLSAADIRVDEFSTLRLPGRGSDSSCREMNGFGGSLKRKQEQTLSFLSFYQICEKSENSHKILTHTF